MKLTVINIRYLTFCTVFACFVFASCTAPIEIPTQDSLPVPVIYGYITDDFSNKIIRISSSSPYFEKKEASVMEDAKVLITDSEGKKYPFHYTENGDYESDQKFSAKEGITYRLRVEMDFDRDGKTEFYEAETTVQPLVKADSIALQPVEIMGFKRFSLNLYLQDPAETKDFYLCKFFVNDTISNDKMNEYIIFNDKMLNGTYLNGVTVHYFEDATDEKRRQDDGNRNRHRIFLSPGDKIKFQVIGIEEGFFKFINECAREKNGENPFFGGPPSNITTNLTNGAVGYFTGYAVYEMERVMP